MKIAQKNTWESGFLFCLDMPCGILVPWQGLNPCPLQCRVLTTRPPGKSVPFRSLICLYFGYAGSLLLLFSSCSERGPLSSCGAWTSHCGGFSCCRATGSRPAGFRSCGARAQPLWHPGISCITACVIFLDRGSNLCFLYFRWILYLWATRKAQEKGFLKEVSLSWLFKDE